MEIWNSEQLRKIKQFESIVHRGYYVNGTELTNLYNEVFNRNLKPTNCASCLRSRYEELERSLRTFVRYTNEQQEEHNRLLKEAENKEVKRGRPRKNKEDKNESTK